ncbi:UNVERIFIED_CONTAM: putative E3 ubiquitin-protein ligase XERICO [Sesamum latifolium]|uniref:E3 ubiquitin-protein ligase XERICO n=1 Tax=Sesamum latifolium TaxID=2727402 RepID=A0AAW2YCX1_9LAMI
MIQIVPRSVVLNYVVSILVHLKWAWDYLLCQSFFQYPYGIMVPEYVDDFNVTCYRNVVESGESAECAVCLCKIDQDDEVRELRCDHFFHRVCLDRWLGYGNMTCPMCRNTLKLPPIAAELHQELVVINFHAAGYGGRDRWWLR